MPLEEDDQARVDAAIHDMGEDPNESRLLVLNATESQKLGPLSVACTILNRTIGSGIFVAPAIVLKGTGTVGASLFLWTAGAVIGMCALMVWLELGLSVPKFELLNRDEGNTDHEGQSTLQCVPRSGGEKNYLEYIYKSPKFRSTCMFAVIYVIFGNLSGNAIAFGIYVCEAAGIEGQNSVIRGLAISVLTAACLLHGFSRKGGIIVNNCIALLKVLILLAIIGIGFAASAGASFGHGPVHGYTVTYRGKFPNFDIHSSFAGARRDAGSYINSILFCIYTFSGFDQPFYVLSEVYKPKRYFAYACLGGQGLAAILFILVNIAYLCVVSLDQRLDEELDMAILFFREVFQDDVASRVMSGIIAFSIFGNIVVMTFTAARVKQELAKEGVLPFSRFFLKSVITPWARLEQRFWLSKQPRYQPERSPTPALFLHWLFSVILIAATSGELPSTAYTVLVSMYSYLIVILVGFFVSSGLLYLRFFSERKTWTINAGFKPWGGPTAAIIFTASCAFLIAAIFVPPSSDSAFAKANTGVYWYIVPTVSLCSLALGYLYYLIFRYVYPPLFKKDKVFVVDREAVIVHENGEYAQALEIVDFSWEARSGPGSNDELELHTVSVVNK